MAVLTWSTLSSGSYAFNPNVDILRFDDTNISAADVLTISSTGTVDIMFIYGGKSVTLQTPSGTITHNNVTFVNGSRLIIGDDTTGTANDNAANTLNGTAGNDLLIGGGGNDNNIGGGGNDVFQIAHDYGAVGAYGNDILNGGTGRDRMFYNVTNGYGVNVNFESGVATGGDGMGSTLTLISIEQVTGTAFNDTLTGSGAPDEWFEGAGGADTINGAGGTDTAIYGGTRAQYVLTPQADGSISVRDVRSGSPDGTDIVSNVEWFQFSDVTISASSLSGGVTVLGNGVSIADGDATPAAADHTDFGAVTVGDAGLVRTFTVRNDGASAITLGAPTLPSGFSLAEPLAGSIAAGASDTFQVHLDTSSMGIKTGDISFTSSSGVTFNFAVTGTVSPTDATFSSTSAALAATVPNLTLTGTADADGAGNDLNNIIIGNSGNNVLAGVDGNDTFIDSAGSDVLLGGAGTDTASFGQPRATYQVQSLPGLMLVSASDGMAVVGGVEKLVFGNAITQSLQGGLIDNTSNWSIVGAVSSSPDHTEVLWKHVDGRVGTWAMTGSSVTSEALVGSATTDWSIAQMADFNGDKKADLLWQNVNGQVALWEMDEGAFMKGSIVGSAPVGWKIVDAGDFDGDAKSDILWHNSQTHQIAIWGMDGPTFRQGYMVGSTPDGWTLQGAADFNGDGKSDLLWRHADGSVAIWTMNGPVFTGGFQVGTAASGSTIVGAADFNGDGKGDILFHNANGQMTVWTMDGPAMTGQFTVGGGATLTSIAGASDYLADGKADILGRDATGHAVLLELNGATLIDTHQLDATTAAVGLDMVGTSGANTLSAGAGNDRYIINNSGDSVVEQLDAGFDTAYSSLASHTLNANVENLVLLPGAANGTGNALDNVLVGTPGANTLSGVGGDDIIYGNGGADTLSGGTGDDSLRVPDLAFTDVDGGAGIDTLSFTGKNLFLDFTQFSNSSVHGLEKVDISGSGNNTLKLNANDVLDFSNTTNQLTVDGNTGDALQISGGTWTDGGAAAGYHTYTSGGATLLVDTDIAVTMVA